MYYFSIIYISYKSCNITLTAKGRYFDDDTNEFKYKLQSLWVDNNRTTSKRYVDYTLLLLEDVQHLHEMVIDGAAKVKFTDHFISIDSLTGDRTGTLFISHGQKAEVVLLD